MEKTFGTFILLNFEAALARLGNNEKIYSKVLSRFSENGNLIDQCLSALERDDYESAERAAHTLKGNAGTVGADTVYEIARHLQTNIHDHPEDKSEILRKIRDMRHEFEMVIKEINLYQKRSREQTLKMENPGPH